jgi:hypothetical protein
MISYEPSPRNPRQHDISPGPRFHPASVVGSGDGFSLSVLSLYASLVRRGESALLVKPL